MVLLEIQWATVNMKREKDRAVQAASALTDSNHREGVTHPGGDGDGRGGNTRSEGSFQEHLHWGLCIQQKVCIRLRMAWQPRKK